MRPASNLFQLEGYQAGTQGAEDQHDPKDTENGKDLENVKRKAGTPSTMTPAPMLKTRS